MKKQFIFLFSFLMVSLYLNAFAQDAKQDFTLVNKTGIVIHNVHITPHDSDEWGDDILGKDVLNNDEETDIIFHRKEKACNWDIRIADSDGNSVEWENIDLCKWAIITLHWDGKTATATFE